MSSSLNLPEWRPLCSSAPYVLIVQKEATDTEKEKLLFVGEVKVFRNRRFKLDKGMVEISSLRPSDAGNYVCRIQVDPHIEVSSGLHCGRGDEISTGFPSRLTVSNEGL